MVVRICVMPWESMICVMPLRCCPAIITNTCVTVVSSMFTWRVGRNFLTGLAQESFILRLCGLPRASISTAAAFYRWNIYKCLYCIMRAYRLSTNFEGI